MFITEMKQDHLSEKRVFSVLVSLEELLLLLLFLNCTQYVALETVQVSLFLVWNLQSSVVDTCHGMSGRWASRPSVLGNSSPEGESGD